MSSVDVEYIREQDWFLKLPANEQAEYLQKAAALPLRGQPGEKRQAPADAPHSFPWRTIPPYCVGCRKKFAPGEPVTLAMHWVQWRGLYDCYREGRCPSAFCAACKPYPDAKELGRLRYSGYIQPLPCVTCGRTVLDLIVSDRPRLVLACSEACRRAYYRSQKPRPKPEPMKCQVCGRLFTAARRDAQTCSATCRQRRRRQRRASQIGVMYDVGQDNDV
jgi:hypothetical protein